MLFSCEIPMGKHFSKKNGRPIFSRGGRSFLGKSSELQLAEKYLHQMLIIEKMKQKLKEPIEGLLWIRFTFNFAKKLSRSRKVMDLSNLYLFPEDCLEKAGIIKNDNLVESHDGSRKKLGEKTSLKIEVFRFTE